MATKKSKSKSSKKEEEKKSTASDKSKESKTESSTKKKSKSTKNSKKTSKKGTTSKKKSTKKSKSSQKSSSKDSSTKSKKEATGAAKKAAMDDADDKIGALAMFLSGETLIEEQREELEQMKKEAKELQKDKMRSAIAQGAVELDETSAYTPDDLKATGGARKVVQKIDLYTWTAPIRVKFPFDQRLFISIVLLSLVFILYLAVLGHYALMFVIIALLFVVYVAGTTEPLYISHTITTRGIDTLDKLYEWYVLGDFWFSMKNGQHLLIVDTNLKSPAQLIILLDEKDVTPVFILLQDKLLYKEMRRQNRISRSTYGKYIPLDQV